MDELKQIGITLSDPALVERYYDSLKAIFVHDLKATPSNKGLILDLNTLPTTPLDFKSAVIKWLVNVNLDRLKRGEEPIITLELVLKCPVWKLIRPPLRKVALTHEKLFGKPSIKTIGQKATPGTINK